MIHLACFDLEISYQPAMEPLFADTDPNAAPSDIWEFWPFGVSIGAIKLSHEPRTILWYDKQPGWTTRGATDEPAQSWSLPKARTFVQLLWDFKQVGYKIFSWNGTGFDWQLLFRITEDERCIDLALHSYDPCFQVLCMVGFPVGLEASALANEVAHAHKEMPGKSAPKEWYIGHYNEVMTYVAGDVLRLEGMTTAIAKQRGLYWETNSGGLRWLMFNRGFLTVEQCLQLPLPDVSWQTNPITREGVIKWMK